MPFFSFAMKTQKLAETSDLQVIYFICLHAPETNYLCLLYCFTYLRMVLDVHH